MILYVVLAAMAAIILILIGKLHILRKTLREIDEGLIQKSEIDTNTPVSISGLDYYARKLTCDINKELALLKKEQRKYRTKNDEIKTAITNIAHDIRTPLTAINGYLEILSASELNDSQRKQLDVIQERTENLKELTEELFSYSLAYAQAEELKYEDFSLGEELANTIASFYGALKLENIEPQITITESPVIRHLDKKAFGRIISNLINNSIKYSSGDLKVTLNEDGCISISNKTSGMNATDVARLFERFYTLQTAKGSTGLGLSIARLLTEKMNGEITAALDSTYLTIQLSFPIQKNHRS